MMDRSYGFTGLALLAAGVVAACGARPRSAHREEAPVELAAPAPIDWARAGRWTKKSTGFAVERYERSCARSEVDEACLRLAEIYRHGERESRRIQSGHEVCPRARASLC